MSSGDARRSQSAISFNVIKKQGKHQHKDQLKDCEKTETLTSEILVSNSSTSTSIQEEGYQFKPFNSSTTTEP